MNVSKLVESWVRNAIALPQSSIEVQEIREWNENNREITIVVTNDCAASDLWHSRHDVERLGYKVVIYTGDRLFDQTYQVRMNSKWAEHNKDVLAILRDIATVTVHGNSEGYPHLFVQPFMGIEKRLNRPIADLLGMPAAISEGVIGKTKLLCIEKAIANREEAIAFYEFVWNEVEWRFKVKAQYSSEFDEIIVQIIDAEPWQIEYWKRHESLKPVNKANQ